MDASNEASSHLDSTSDSNQRKQSISTALTSDLIESGKELLAAGKIPGAVEELSEACQFLAKEFGETAEECGSAYLYYGKALLELARLENKVLGNALEGFDVTAKKDEESAPPEDTLVEDVENMTVDEKLDVEEKVAVALEENFGKIDQIVKLHTGAESDDESEDDMDDEEGESEEAGPEEPSDKVEMSVDSEGGKDEDMEAGKEAEEVGNLQSAWEVLELAKIAFGKTVARTSGERQREAEENFCSTILTLAEVSMENENYEIAVEDFTLCIEKGKAVLPPNSRFLAEVQYQRGQALGYLKRLPEAEAALDEAIAVLKARQEDLQKEETSEARDKELEEMDILVVDIEEAKVGLRDLVARTEQEGAPEGSASTQGFTKVDDGKAASTIGIKMAKDGGVEGPAMA